jgi:hypothetical protein
MHHPQDPTSVTTSPRSRGLAGLSPQCFISGAVTGTSNRPKCRLPKSLCLAPPTPPLLRALRWDDPSCVPPRWCEVRAERSAQAWTRTGRLRCFVVLLSVTSPFYRLSAEPWRLTQRVGRRQSLRPPVVAMGSIPHIYRREGHSPGDPDRSCPDTSRSHSTRLAMSVYHGAELFQREQSELPAKERDPHFAVVVVVLALELHTA